MDNIWSGIRCFWQGDERPTEVALKHAASLITATRAAGFPPEAASRGYWPTVRLLWKDGEIEVEVHDDHYELYFFSGSSRDGNFSIMDYPINAPGILEALASEIQKRHSILDL
ncbi:hypothetical protein CN878_20395 [Ochrobactrum sp. 695/2009]|nr:hypothetical protein [Brucella intermedia]PJR90038.1 hypothetical protein CN881_12655 [Ochrobactrum sp. 721/2009]PJT16674.1 hypothetical protein CN880_10080 [Ochrobactrum sp. 720/2009]PJT26496.1 hypothetical protein CN879_06045 [Ochrobactrum sp. 715/2009]PJT26814.1 hypothetical protein CN878_20395 [Ochrobactrum sp. 695/2009]PJT36016.1 hypothetical protein CN877_08490 [Ochrobactrum sp. 689/2009]